MTPQDLIAAFDVLADAPDGVKRLRELVLSLAVRGQLVAQDPEDGTAARFLGQLVEAGWTTPRGMPSSVEAVWDIPESWRWVPFGRTHINRDRERVPLSRAQRSGREGPYDYYGASGVIDQLDDYLFDKPLLLIGEDGANLVLRSTPIAFIATGKYWVNNHAHVLDSVDADSLRYLAIFVNATDLKPYLTGIAQPKLNQKRMNGIPCPLPPLAEQRRIVARVDELMGLLDRLEAARTHRDEVRTKARDAALADLRDAPDSEAVEAAWGRIARQMDDLFTTPDDVAPLRQAILQLAVRGLLTRSQAGDWGETTLGRIVEDRPRNGWSPKTVDHPTDVKTLKLSATTKGYFDGTQFKFVEPGEGIAERLWLFPGDLLIQRANTPDYVGTAAVFDGPPKTYIYPDLMMKCRVKPSHDVRFIHIQLSTPTYRAWIKEKASGTSKSMVKVNQGTVKSIPLVLPPLAEQHRIVAKVDALMAICDRLESRLTTAVELHAQFAAAAVHHLDAAP